MKCTWKDCDADAKHPHDASDGSIWADLCDVHHALMECPETMPGDPNFDAKILLSRWVKAQGGAKKTADAMLRNHSQ